MTDKAWQLDRLGAMADEWIAEREMVLSSMHAYLNNHLQHFPQSKAEPLAVFTAMRSTATAVCIQPTYRNLISPSEPGP